MLSLITLILAACVLFGLMFYAANKHKIEFDVIEDTLVTNEIDVMTTEADALEMEEVERNPPPAVAYVAKILHIIGNEFINPKAYGSNGALGGVFTDLGNVHDFYVKQGGWLNIYGEPLGNFDRDVLHGEKATASAMKNAILQVASTFNIKGKKLFKQYSSGHGSQVFKKGDDQDNYAEVFVLYDQTVEDDEYRRFLQSTLNDSFDVILETDRCFSGGLSKAILGATPKSLPANFAEKVPLATFLSAYNISKGCKIKYISASSENETAGDLGEGVGGSYTSVAYRLRRAQAFSYSSFIAACIKNVRGQKPTLSNANDEKYKDWTNTKLLQ